MKPCPTELQERNPNVAEPKPGPEDMVRILRRIMDRNPEAFAAEQGERFRYEMLEAAEKQGIRLDDIMIAGERLGTEEDRRVAKIARRWELEE